MTEKICEKCGRDIFKMLPWGVRLFSGPEYEALLPSGMLECPICGPTEKDQE